MRISQRRLKVFTVVEMGMKWSLKISDQGLEIKEGKLACYYY
jgi:hypothetical protein